MKTLVGRNPWAFAGFYMATSLLVEIFLMVGVGWKVPQDNARIAPVLLTLAPALAAALSGFRRPLKDLLTVVAFASLLTLLITVVVSRLSGISTGLIEPIINRSIAGWLAAAITNRLSAKHGQDGSVALATSHSDNPSGPSGLG